MLGGIIYVFVTALSNLVFIPSTLLSHCCGCSKPRVELTNGFPIHVYSHPGDIGGGLHVRSLVWLLVCLRRLLLGYCGSSCVERISFCADRKSCDCAPCVGAVIAFVLGRTLFRSWVSSLARQYPKVALMDQVPDSRLVDQQRDLEGTRPPWPGLSRLSVPRRVREGHREEGGRLEDSASSTPLAHAPLQR
jgi:hypothetical protein